MDDQGRDHRAVGVGRVDFARIAPYVRPESTVVLELGPDVAASDVVASRERLQAFGIG